MAFNIASFFSNGIVNGGVRPTLFDVTLIGAPGALTGFAQKFTFTCRGTSVPASTLGDISVPYFGRTIKIAGDRTWQDWSVTVMNDEDFIVRNTFESWSNQINTLVGNTKTLPGLSYMTDAIITQYSKDSSSTDGSAPTITKQYRIVNLFPTEIGSMDLDWESTNQIQTFGVNFAYSWMEPITNGFQSFDIG